MIDVSRHFLADPCIYIIQVVRSSTSLALINPALINNQVTDFFFLQDLFPEIRPLTSYTPNRKSWSDLEKKSECKVAPLSS